MSDNQWIPVGERLPELDVQVLVAAAGRNLLEIGWREHCPHYIIPSVEWTLGDELDRGERPKWITHWMPLPPPPLEN